MDMVLHASHSVEVFFDSRRGEFLVVIKVYDAWLTMIETSAEAEFVSSGACSMIGKTWER